VHFAPYVPSSQKTIKNIPDQTVVDFFELDSALVAKLQAHTEGWPVGMKLALHALRGLEASEAVRRVHDYVSSDDYVFDYFGEQVIAGRTPEVIGFLTDTSILRRLHAGLCEAVSGCADGDQILASLVNESLFISSVEGHKGWYRYHPMFAEFLATRLSTDRRRELHARAAEWYERRSMFAEAVRHAFQAENEIAALRLVRANALRLLTSGRYATLLKWIDALSHPSRASDGELSLHEAWAAFLSHDTERARAAIARWTAGGRSTGAAAEAQVDARYLVLSGWIEDSADSEVDRCSLECASRFDSENVQFFRHHAMALYGKRNIIEARAADAIPVLERLRTEATSSGPGFFAIYALHLLAYAYLDIGRRSLAERICTGYLEDAALTPEDPSPLPSLLYAPLALCRYYADDLQSAQELAERALSIAQDRRVFDRYELDSGAFVLSRVFLARHEFEAARAISVNSLSGRFAPRRELIRTLEALNRGDRDSAARTTSTTKTELPFPTVVDDTCALTLGLMIEFGANEQAELVLSRLADDAETHRRFGSLVHLRLLQAKASLVSNERERAKSYVLDALTMAAPEDFRRPFLEAGMEIGKLISETAPTPLSFAGQLATSMRATPETQSAGPPVEPGPVEPLSKREREIMAHVARGMSNAEIADALFVSVGTVKWHVNNIFSKLDVKNRTSAINRARELGDLS